MTEVKASFDLSTKEGKMRAFNARNGSSESIKNLSDGTVLEVVAVMQYPETTDTYGQQQEVTVTVLFATDGKSYAGVSDTIAKSADGLIDLLMDDDFESVDVKIVKAKSSGGREFFNLQLV